MQKNSFNHSTSDNIFKSCFHIVVQVLDPVNVGVVALCSTKNLLLEGGPLPWILDTSGYYEEGT